MRAEPQRTRRRIRTLFSDDLMKGCPVAPGGSLKGKPMWWGTFGCFAASVFFWLDVTRGRTTPGTNLMARSDSSKAQQIAHAATSFERQTTGRPPGSVTVVLSEETLVITLRGVLSPAEIALARSPEGSAQLREFHRQLFATASGPLRQAIRRITGVEVCEATAEVDTLTGTVVQVFSLADAVPADTWSGIDPGSAGKEPDVEPEGH